MELQDNFGESPCPFSPEDWFIVVIAIALDGDGVEVDEISCKKTPRQRPLSAFLLHTDEYTVREYRAPGIHFCISFSRVCIWAGRI